METVDVKGLEHEERQQLIFSNLEKTEKGEILRLVVDKNPLPLVYMLKSSNEFRISYEKEGPDEWILKIEKTAVDEDKKKRLKELLDELKQGKVSEKTKEKAKQLFQEVDAKTLGLVEQELIREGVSHDEIRKSLCDIHLEVLKESLVSKRIEVEAPHPVHTLMEEHKVIVESLHELADLVKRLKGTNSFDKMGKDLEKLKEITHHLVDAENHHKREEDVLFPKLEQHDIVEPPEIMKMDHVEFRKRKQELYKMSQNPEDYDFADFKKKVIEFGEYLTLELESHIFKEDNILYQIALQVLSEKEWKDVKKGCDKIGYCCFTPEDQKKDKVVELDLRPMPPFERHEKIFHTWDGLKAGEALKIINDHDPKPLWYQFEVEHKGKYKWEYEQKGPKDWIVEIAKV